MSSPVPSAPGSLTVLVAEDEALVRFLTVEVLREAGFTVAEAGDGVEALSVLESTSIDVLLTDIQMPRLNGYQLAEAALTRWPRLRIVLMTGYARDAVPAAVARANLRTLHKPFDVDKLPGIVAELMGAR